MRPVIQTFTGRAFNLFAPTVDMLHIEDIAHALSHLTRFTGHGARRYSIAEHSIHVASLLPPSLKLYGLLHDASEAYLNDLSSPLKHDVRLTGYRDVEHVLEAVISEKFRLPTKHPLIKAADLNMLAIEAKVLLKQPLIPEWNWVFEIVSEPVPVKLKHWTPDVAKRKFMQQYNALSMP